MSGGVVGFLKSIAGICDTPELDASLWHLEGSRAIVQVSRVSELQDPSGAVYLGGQGLSVPLLIVRGEDENYFAFANRCTHIGHRKLDPVPGKSQLRCCSVSHSIYDYQGNVVKGPAKKSITAYSTELKEDKLIVNL